MNIKELFKYYYDENPDNFYDTTNNPTNDLFTSLILIKNKYENMLDSGDIHDDNMVSFIRLLLLSLDVITKDTYDDFDYYVNLILSYTVLGKYQEINTISDMIYYNARLHVSLPENGIAREYMIEKVFNMDTVSSFIKDFDDNFIYPVGDKVDIKSTTSSFNIDNLLDRDWLSQFIIDYAYDKDIARHEIQLHYGRSRYGY